jgi:hypothetical protein
MLAKVARRRKPPCDPFNLQRRSGRDCLPIQVSETPLHDFRLVADQLVNDALVHALVRQRGYEAVPQGVRPLSHRPFRTVPGFRPAVV